MAEVRWTLTAAEDLRVIEDWIAKDSPLHAVDFVDRLIGSTKKLVDSPQVGRVVPEFNRTDLREVLFRGYRIVYSREKDFVTILRVLHGARDVEGLGRREPWTFE